MKAKSVYFRLRKRRRDAGIAIIPQEINLELDLSIAENIMLGRLPVNKLGFIKWEYMNRVAKELLQTLNVTSLNVTLPVRTLNASMQQLVSIARALYRNPKVLILDEPTSCLTEAETESLFAAVNKLKKRRISCLYISHKLDEVLSLCDRVVVLRDGKFVAEHVKESYDSQAIINDIVGRQVEMKFKEYKQTIGEEVLRVENFKVPHPFTYGQSIIQDVSFSLHKGEILGLCGLVGSGRSELLNAIFGVIAKTRGKVYVGGKLVNIKNPMDAKKYGIGLLTENRKKDGYIGCLSIKENMTTTILNQISNGIFIDREKQKRCDVEILR